MDTSKKKDLALKKHTNALIIISTIWLLAWYIFLSVLESDKDKLFFSPLLRVPIIIGAFGMSLGFGNKSKDKLGIFVITLFVGLFISYLFSVPFEMYKDFLLFITNHDIL